ncbi:unnamed protein product [Meganyctiphanes norvegica]|uniref:DUF4097 domain-containing protein n=1 Tax=Meganyctiphanes norvegica TaxID=48144 RepID=A0AAV2PR21_MEGNR
MRSTFLNTFLSISRVIKVSPSMAMHYNKSLINITVLRINNRSLFTHNVENYLKISENKFKVKPGFGNIKIEGSMDYIVKSTNPHEYPNADHAIVTVYGISEKNNLVDIHLNPATQDELTVSDNQPETSAYCQIELPIKYDIDINLKGAAGVHIENMESDEASVKTDRGHLSTKGFKSHNLQFITNCGHLKSKGTLQGNLFLKGNTTHVEAKRLQGLKMVIICDELSTNVDSSYITTGLINANSGDIKLHNLHGSTNIAVKKGSIKITGLRGQLSSVMDEGSINVQVSDVWKESSIKLNTGSLTLSLPQNSSDHFEVTAPALEIESEISMSGEEIQNKENLKTFKRQGTNDQECIMRAEVNNGTASVKTQDWFSTLGIKMGA